MDSKFFTKKLIKSIKSTEDRTYRFFNSFSKKNIKNVTKGMYVSFLKDIGQQVCLLLQSKILCVSLLYYLTLLHSQLCINYRLNCKVKRALNICLYLFLLYFVGKVLFWKRKQPKFRKIDEPFKKIIKSDFRFWNSFTTSNIITKINIISDVIADFIESIGHCNYYNVKPYKHVNHYCVSTPIT